MAQTQHTETPRVMPMPSPTLSLWLRPEDCVDADTGGAIGVGVAACFRSGEGGRLAEEAD